VGPRLVERMNSRSQPMSKEPARVSENGGLRA
jgi:hypothetical protein